MQNKAMEKSLMLALLWLATSRALVLSMRSLASGRVTLRTSIGMTSFDILGRPAQSIAAKTAEGMGVGRSELVVKVYSVHNAVSPHLPWTSKAQEESTGSGFSIKHDGLLCILTNAHVVADATYVEVRKAGDSRKYVALRRKISHECDLATLTVDDDSFWRETAPLTFGAVPCLQDEVSVVGYPEGGEGVSVTVGVVSRIEIQRYAHSGANLLAIQIDAAINPGNSGGPALDDAGRVIGVAFQNQQDSQNIGYVIPVPTIYHFLADTAPRAAADGVNCGAAGGGTEGGDAGSCATVQRCRGFCSLGIFWQALENEQLRRYYGLDDTKHSGVLVRGLSPLAAAASMLRRDDVILSVGDHAVANDGSFAVGAQERLSFQHLIHLRYPGELVPVQILRGGKILTLCVPVQPLHRLVPAVVYDESQPYFLYGGFAFVGLTEPYLHEWGDDWMSDAPQDLVHLALTGVQRQCDEQPVSRAAILRMRPTARASTE
jgi:S1-C subfamily serine protease